VEADSQEQAERRAARMGILVANAYESTIHDAVTHFDQEGEETTSSSATSPDSDLDTIAYYSKLPPALRQPAVASSVPEYRGLKAASMVFRIVATLNLVVAGVVLTMTLWAAVTDGPSRAAIGLLGILPVVVIGVLFYGACEALLALRDIARNSFRRS
jgi:hypothetical protein